jgi:hypothetical protein
VADGSSRRAFRSFLLCEKLGNQEVVLNFFQKYYLHYPQEVLVFLCPFLSVFPFFAVT